MSTFTYTPDFGATKQSKPRKSSIAYGDGYEGRVAYGLNTNLKTWSVQFLNRDSTEADAIEAFLDARGGTEAFTWTPPLALASSNFVCDEWQRSTVKNNLNSISAVFREVAEP